MFKVNDTTVAQVLKKLDRTQESALEDVKTIEKWIEQQPHFLVPLERRTILNFLILNKMSIEKTKQKIENYYTIRTHLTEIYEEMNPRFRPMKEIRQMQYFIPHPQLLEHRRVFLSKIRDVNLANHLDPYNLLRYVMSIHEMRMREDVLAGEIFIVDCSNYPVSYFLKLTPNIIFNCMIVIYKKIYSMRLHALYLFNFPPIAEKILNTAKAIMKPKIFERIYTFSDDSVLKREFSEDFLPEDFGGKGASLEKLQVLLDCEFEKHQEFFDRLDKVKVDETLRPEKLENDEELGFHGNFKKLDID